MQDVQKKKHSPHARGRLWLVVLAALLLAGVLLLWQRANAPKETSASHTHDMQYVLVQRTTGEVAAITTTQRLGGGWTLTQDADGGLTLLGAEDQIVDSTYASLLLDAAAYMEASALLTDDPAEYRGQLADFGLDQPRVMVNVAYTDGHSITLRIGDQISIDDNRWMYMTVDGDDSLYALDKGTADLYTLDGPLLLSVQQPVLHRQRFDSVTIALAGGETLQWTLEGDITNTDAQDRWLLTEPLVYPADASALFTLRQHIENLLLGAYVGPATADNLTRYGFDAPQMTLTVHQAAGDIGTTGITGELAITSYPESTVTLVVGGAKSQDVDYVRWEDSIYISSHYTLSALMNIRWRDTLSRYPVLTALGNLSRLTVETAAGAEVYEITRTEQVAANNDLVYDADGQLVYDLVCTRNGTAVSYAVFEAAYNRLMTVSVSGSLPDGWDSAEPPHTTYTFEDVDGRIHTIALARFDALHDAVIVNGRAMFYLIQGGFVLDME